MGTTSNSPRVRSARLFAGGGDATPRIVTEPVRLGERLSVWDDLTGLTSLYRRFGEDDEFVDYVFIGLD